MKTLLSLFTLIAGLGFAQAQQSACPLISSEFTQQDLEQAAERLGVSVDFACFIAEKGVKVNDFSGRNLDEYEDISSLSPAMPGVEAINPQNFNAAQFNLLKYDVQLLDNQQQMYRIGNTGKVLSIYSRTRLNNLYSGN